MESLFNRFENVPSIIFGQPHASRDHTDEENIPGKEPHIKKEIENENIFDFIFCPKYFPSI